MNRYIFLVIVLFGQLVFVNTSIKCASIQHEQLLFNMQVAVDSRVLFRQLCESIILKLQKNKSLDLSSWQLLLDYYGIQQKVTSKNEAIRLILKGYYEKQPQLVCNTANVLVVSQELPRTVSQVSKIDFRLANEAAGFGRYSNSPRGPENYALSYKGQYVSVGLDLKPISGVMTQYEYIMQAEARRSWMQFCIEHDPGLYLEYRAQRVRCVDLIKRMLDVSTNPDALAAQLSVNSLYLFDVYDEGAILCDWVKPGIQNALFKNGNFVGIDSQENLGKLLRVVNPFLREVLSNKEYIELLQEYKIKSIVGADILLKRALGTNGYWDSIKNYVSGCLSSFPQSLDGQIANSRMMQNCVKVTELCKVDKFDEARKIVTSLRTCTNSESFSAQVTGAHYLSKLIENEYSTSYNAYGIRYTDTIDPFYPIAKSILDSCPYAQKYELQVTIQETIYNRAAELDKLLINSTRSQKESAYVKAVGYRILDAESNNEIIDILSPFAKDHADENSKVVYRAFASKGLPSFLKANEISKQFSMPISIELAANTKARKWYGYCANVEIQTNDQKELISKALSHLALACEENSYQAEHLYMVQCFYADAIGVHVEKLFLKIPNLAHSPAKSLQGYLERELLVKICEDLRSAKDEQEVLKVIERTKEVWGVIQTSEVNSLKQMQSLWNAHQENNVLSGSSEIYPEKELEAVEEEFDPPYGCGNSFVQEMQRALVNFAEGLFEWEEPYGGVLFPGSERAKNLYDPEGQEIEEEIDVSQIPQCNGGQQALPSFGDSIGEGERESEDDETSEKADTEAEILENIIKEALEGKKLTEEQISKVEEFKKQLEGLVKEYGIEIILEATNIYKLTISRICNNGILAVKKIAKMLWVINENETTKAFKYDIAHNNATTPSSVEEALAGKMCVDQGLLPPLKRGVENEDDFIEVESGIRWDVKTPRSESLEGKKIFNIEKIIASLKIAYDKDENLIIHITNLHEDDLKIFYKEFKKEFGEKEFAKTIIVHPEGFPISKNRNQFAEFMRSYDCTNNV